MKMHLLEGLEQYQNVIANNIAASHVAGFKKVAVSFEALRVVKLPVVHMIVLGTKCQVPSL